MTYKDLANKILQMPEDKQADDVTLLLMNSNEVIGTMDFVTDWDNSSADTLTGEVLGVGQVIDILDEGHPYITVDF